MKPENDIRQFFRKAAAGTEPGMDEKVLAKVLAAHETTHSNDPVPNRSNVRSTIMRSPTTKLATAAAVLLALAVGMYALTGSFDGTSVTMAKVRQAMDSIDWMQIINEGSEGRTESDRFSFVSKVHIQIDQHGRIVYRDFGAGRQYHWLPDGQDIYESSIESEREFASGAAGPFEMIDRTFRFLQTEHDARVTKESGNDGGRQTETWTITHPVKSGGGRTLKVCFDVERMLPVSATYEHTGVDGAIHRESNIRFEYPQTGPADIYEAGAPKSAQIKPAPME